MPYLPLAELEEALEEARAWTFNPDLPEKDLTRILSFKSDTIDYFDSYWLHGSIEPATWNYWQHSRGNTNNRYLSSIKSISKLQILIIIGARVIIPVFQR